MSLKVDFNVVMTLYQTFGCSTRVRSAHHSPFRVQTHSQFSTFLLCCVPPPLRSQFCLVAGRKKSRPINCEFSTLWSAQKCPKLQWDNTTDKQKDFLFRLTNSFLSLYILCSIKYKRRKVQVALILHVSHFTRLSEKQPLYY